MTFRDILKALRFESGLTQDQLAARAGISTVAITQLEIGRTLNPRIETLAALARALNVPLGRLTEPWATDAKAAKGRKKK